MITKHELQGFLERKMIDTITLTTQDFDLDIEQNESSKYPLRQTEECNLSPTLQHKTQPFFMKDVFGKDIFGTGLTLARTAENQKGTMRNTAILKIGNFEQDHQIKQHLSIQASIPKFLNGDNFYLANHADTILYSKQLEKELAEMGIYTDVSKMVVSRLDLTRNAKTDYPFWQYVPFFRVCNATRMKDSEICSSTYTFRNKSKMLCNYDKIEEQRQNNKSIPMGLENSNILRCEFRQLHKRNIIKAGFNNFQEIINGYDELNNIYNQNVKKIMFDNFNKDSMLTDKRLVNIEDMAMKHIEEQSKNWIDKLITDVLLQTSQESLTLMFDNLDSILEIESEHLAKQGATKDYIKTNRYRHKKAFKEKLTSMLAQLDTSYGVPYTQLYEELYTKLLKVS